MCTGSVDNIIDLIGFEDKAKEIVDTLFSISFPFWKVDQIMKWKRNTATKK